MEILKDDGQNLTDRSPISPSDATRRTVRKNASATLTHKTEVFTPEIWGVRPFLWIGCSEMD